MGDPQAGFTYAKEVCSKCHGISEEKSPLPKETSHPTMSNIVVEPQDMLNVIAYILDLKGRKQHK